MRDISFVAVPIAQHAFFEQTEFQCLFCHHLLHVTGFAAQILHLVSVCGTRCVTCQPLLAGFRKVLRPFVVDPLRDAFAAAQLSDTVFPTQAIQDVPDLLFR